MLEHTDGGATWPYAGKPCWVLSSRDLPVPKHEDADVRIVEGQVAQLIDEMLDSAGERDLWIVGGGNVASQFADHGLLDRLEVTIVPVVLGAGKPLFDRRLPAADAADHRGPPAVDGRPDLRDRATGRRATRSGLSSSSESSTSAARRARVAVFRVEKRTAQGVSRMPARPRAAASFRKPAAVRRALGASDDLVDEEGEVVDVRVSTRRTGCWSRSR